jgi:uncharacterized membrane protein
MEERPDPPRRSGYWGAIRKRKEEILSVREEMAKRRSWLAAGIDWVGDLLANPVFFTVLLAAHVGWVVANVGWLPGVRPWDPYPFMLLATIASAEAPFIALLILMRQHRDQHIDELREEVTLQVDLHVEREATKALRMLAAIHEKLGIETENEGDLERMTEELDPRLLLEDLEERLEEAEEVPPTGSGSPS